MDWWGLLVDVIMKEQWSFVSMDCGRLLEMMLGMTEMQKLCAPNWDFTIPVSDRKNHQKYNYSHCWYCCTGARAVRGTLYGRSRRNLYYNWVDCTGTEANITQCTHSIVSNDLESPCKRVNVAGVVCHTTHTPTSTHDQQGLASMLSTAVRMHQPTATRSTESTQSSCSAQSSNVASPTTVIKIEANIQATILSPACPTPGS